MDVFLLAIGSVAVGLAVGVLSGLLGIGGGTILVPTFKLGYLMDSIACTATSLFTVVPTSVSGAISHLRNKTCVPALGIAAGLGGAVTSPLGVWLASRSADWMIMLAAAAIIAYSACTMLKKAFKMPAPEKGAFRANARAARARRAVEAGASSFPVTPKQLAVGAIIGLVAGVASGYVGVGGGFLMVPLMIQFVHMPMKTTSGTSLIAVMILAVPGVVYQAVLGNVNWVVGIAVAAGSIPGAAVGAKLVSWVPERTLRFIFGGLLFVAAVLLIVNQTGFLG